MIAFRSSKISGWLIFLSEMTQICADHRRTSTKADLRRNEIPSCVPWIRHLRTSATSVDQMSCRLNISRIINSSCIILWKRWAVFGTSFREHLLGILVIRRPRRYTQRPRRCPML